MSIKLNESFWDCECDINFIHDLKKGDYCPICGACAKDGPNSRQNEINSLYDPKKDTAIVLENSHF